MPKKIYLKNVEHFFQRVFFIPLESSETYADLSYNKIRANLIFSSATFVEICPRNLKLQFCEMKKNHINRNFVLAYVSEHCASFGTKNSIEPLLSGGVHVVNKE